MRASEPDVAVRMYLNNGIVTVTVNGAVVANSGSAVLSAGSWYHVAYSRSSGNGALFLDGVNRGNGTDANSYPAKGVAVGGTLTSNYFTGYIDEVMIRTDQAINHKLHSNDKASIKVLLVSNILPAHGARVQCYNHTYQTVWCCYMDCR